MEHREQPESNTSVDRTAFFDCLGMAPVHRLTPHVMAEPCPRIAIAIALARWWSILSNASSAASDKAGLDRAIRPSRTIHSSSAIGDTASITSSDGSILNRPASIGRASIPPICPRAYAADLATASFRSSRRSIIAAMSSGRRGLRDLIRRMSKENPLWGAPRIHGELPTLGFELAKSTVSTYMIRRRHPPSQSWRTFLRNHAEAIAAIDLCLVPTARFESLFALVDRPRTAATSVVCGDPASDRGMAGAADYRGFSVGDGSSLSGARQ